MLRAIIFDLDGVISDTQKVHSKVESSILKKYGINISPKELTEKYSGMRTDELFNELLKKTYKKYDLNKVIKEKWKIMEDLANKSVDAIKGSEKLIKELYEKGFKLAIASASDYGYVEAVLKKLSVKKYFTAIISGDMVEKSKPHPETFLKAAEKLNVNPTKCLVIEDAPKGIEAANKGGMKSLAITTTHTKNSLKNANLIISNFSELDLKKVKELFD